MSDLQFQAKQKKLSNGVQVIIIKVLGVIDGTTVGQFEDNLTSIFAKKINNIILICSEIRYINSTGMGLLVNMTDNFRNNGGNISLVAIPEKVKALFDMLGLLSIFKIYATEAEALAYYAAKTDKQKNKKEIKNTEEKNDQEQEKTELLRQGIVQLLEGRFGKLPEKIAVEINKKAVASLEHLLQSAATIDSIVQFTSELFQKKSSEERTISIEIKIKY